MIRLAADYIISPLGEGTDVNLHAVLSGKTGLRQITDWPDVEPFFASLFSPRTNFTELAVKTVQKAIEHTNTDITDKRTILIVSSTKGENFQLAEPADAIARQLGFSTKPIVVSNACTSGVCAQVVAQHLILHGDCDTAVILGIDLQSRFIVSGFQSFKALSPMPCHPFDTTMQGLNVGEAAAAMILTNKEIPSFWQLTHGSIHNDANHISAPSREGEGSWLCLRDVMQNSKPSDFSMVSLHGTGTVYNDTMESVAVHRAGLDNVPACSLKGNFGHTMGAAGVLETILSLHALQEHKLLPTLGYQSQGTPYPLNLSAQSRDFNDAPKDLIKLISGFGGTNAAVRYSKMQ